MGRSQVLGAWALRFMVCCNAMCFSAFRTCFVFCIGIISLLYSRVRIWPKKKKQSDCCLLVVATLKYQVISCKLLFNLVSWPHLSRASTGGKGFYVLVPHSHGGPRPLANCRYSNPCVNIGTPQGTPRSWSGRSPHNLLQLDIRIEAIMGGGSTVLYYGNATREGVPSHATLNMMRQANLQQNFQRNELTTNFLP